MAAVSVISFSLAYNLLGLWKVMLRWLIGRLSCISRLKLRMKLPISVIAETRAPLSSIFSTRWNGKLLATVETYLGNLRWFIPGTFLRAIPASRFISYERLPTALAGTGIFSWPVLATHVSLPVLKLPKVYPETMRVSRRRG
jgi:hypothetical protein